MNKANNLIPLVILLVIGGAIYLFGFINEENDEVTNAPSIDEVIESAPPIPSESNIDAEIIGDAEQKDFLETTQTVAARQKRFEERLDTITDEVSSNVSTGVWKKLESRHLSEFEKMKAFVTKNNDLLMRNVNNLIAENSKKTVIMDEDGNVVSEVGSNLEYDTDIPKGLGFDDLPVNRKNAPNKDYLRKVALSKSDNKRVVLGPSSSSLFDSNGQKLMLEKKKSGERTIKKAKFEKTNSQENKRKAKAAKKEKPIPAYTIPVNATLFENTTLTALMGVVPNKGRVKDPLRFKVITGPENIATNGHYLADVRNIVWSGWAQGNREMSCVRGIVDTVTFTFNDGTIYTQNSSDKKVGLGYITDERGKQCIPGHMISNAEQYLRNRMIVAGAASGAKAASQINTKKIQTNDENTVITTILEGDTGDFLLGETGAGSLKELALYLRERQMDAIDLVFIETGQLVTLHVEQEITIDFDPNGRRLVHNEFSSEIAGSSFD